MNSADQFEEIVREHYEPLFRFAMSLAKNEPDAGDLTQQTFYVWATKGHQLRETAKVKTWLFTTLYRSFLMARRTLKRFANEEFETASQDLPAPGNDAANYADCPQALAALASLDEIFQAPVALFYLEDISYAEIAEVLEIPIGTVKSRIARGIAQLRKILLSDDFSTAVNRPKATRLERDFSISPAREQTHGHLNHKIVLCRLATG